MSGITGAVAGAVGLFKVPESCCTTEPDDPACQASVQVPLSGTVTGVISQEVRAGGAAARTSIRLVRRQCWQFIYMYAPTSCVILILHR